jgi:hypothetical protein
LLTNLLQDQLLAAPASAATTSSRPTSSPSSATSCSPSSWRGAWMTPT